MSDRSTHVLVVDDDPDQRAILHHLLTAQGWTVSEASDGEEALSLAIDEQPDLVILDVSMPGRDGFAVCERMRELLSETNAPHVIFVTGRTELQHSLRGLEAGALDYITKPFVPEDLLARARVAVRLKAQLDALAAGAATDPLTGLWNRQQLAARGRELVALATRHGTSLSCIMLDVDDFKLINDHHGHLAGDAVLQQLARCMQAALRESDLLFRYGGDEFLIIATQTDGGRAWQIADRLRRSVAAQPFRLPEGAQAPELPVRISVGCATWEQEETFASLLNRADRALYRSKRCGRNCTSRAPDESLDERTREQEQ